MNNEVTKAWTEFIKDYDKAIEEILSALNGDLENEEQKWAISFLMGMAFMGMAFMMAFTIYKLVSSLVKKNK